MEVSTPSHLEVFEGFAQIVAKSLRIDVARVVPEAYLEDLGAESLDLIEISMEVESHFNVWLAEKSILDTAAEVFGPGVLESDGYLTEEGRRLMLRRMPEGDAAELSGEIAVTDLRHYFMKVSTWVSMIESLLERTPVKCSACDGALKISAPLRMKCVQCGAEVSLRSGEDLNREWVQEYYEREYLGSNREFAKMQNSGL
ncbi:MAG TPA: acyl carrier protein [Bryobacteraceae bacterium]|nr:acyl carrier protein [Bryobacteraceae bacterium]